MDLLCAVEEIVIDDHITDEALPHLVDPIVIKPEYKVDTKDDALQQAVDLLYAQNEGDFEWEKKYSRDLTFLGTDDLKQEEDFGDTPQIELQTHVVDHMYGSKKVIPKVDSEFYENLNSCLKNLNLPSQGVSTTVLLPENCSFPRQIIEGGSKTLDFIDNTLESEVSIVKSEEPTSGDSSRSSLPRFSCQICYQTFASKFSVFRHELRHTMRDRFLCEFCDRSLSTVRSLYRHIQIVHIGEKKHECDVCGKKFALEQGLTHHMRCHTGERPYECDFCDKSFTSHSHLKNHLLSHSDVRAWKCVVCDKAYKRREKLQKHYRTHETDKAFRCRQCKKSYASTEELTEHCEAHHQKTGPVTCGLCKKQYCTKYYLAKHKCWAEGAGQST